MLDQVPTLLLDAIMTEWESPAQMWETIAAELGCTVERAQELSRQFAFVSPFSRDGQWQGLPKGRSCKLCASKPTMHGETLCARHTRQQANLGIFGDWQYHRMCRSGELDKHAPAQIDRHGVPRCPLCQKSMIAIPADAIAKFRRAKAINKQLTQATKANPADLPPGKMFRLLQAKKRTDAPVRNPRK
jgi:hypothetical protein